MAISQLEVLSLVQDAELAYLDLIKLVSKTPKPEDLEV